MTIAPRVFISYSHDSDAHRERVLALSERLRRDGIETILDRYVNGTPDKGWPRWMLDGLDAADRVLLVCTPTYYRRFRGHEAPDKGKGVDWEGAVITQEIYDARSATTRFIPVLFDPADDACIPEPVRGHNHYFLTSEPAYQALYDALLDQAGVEPGPLWKLKPKERQRGRPLDFGDAEEPGERTGAPRIDLTHLSAGAEHFLGRETELAALDTAWADSGQAAKVCIVELIAPGGTGKTALVKRWLDGLRAAGWAGGQTNAKRVFGWSFYSQGTGEDRQASEDHFLASALKWFGVEIDPATNPADKGRTLAQAVAKDCTLLVLDGIEPLQYPPGPLAGELRAPGLKALLTHLASSGQPGLCVVTSREWLQDLAEWVRRAGHPSGAVLRLDLGNLSDSDGAGLLHALGANRTGASAIGADDPELDPELIRASQEVQGHALTLSLLGNYLRLAYDGDIRRRDLVDLRDADAQTGGHAFRVMAAYEHWLAGAGEWGARGLAVLRMLGLFDRPASAADIAALRAAPPIQELTEALFKPSAGEPAPPDATAEPLPTAQWNIVLKRLAEAGLITPPEADGSLDAHPLVRQYLAATLKQTSSAA